MLFCASLCGSRVHAEFTHTPSILFSSRSYPESLPWGYAGALVRAGGWGVLLSVQVFKCRIGGGLDPEVFSFPFFSLAGGLLNRDVLLMV